MRWFIGLAALALLACDDGATATPADALPADGGAPDQTVADAEPDAAPDAEPDMAAPREPFTVQVLDGVRISSLGDDPYFQNALGSFDLGDGPFSRVILTVDLDTTCYPFERWQDDRPPAGQNWPPSCDAFDRNFEAILDEPPAGEDGPPGIEVMRAITPFGGPAQHVIDLTDLANARPGAHPLRIHITTWPDGAGQVSGSAGGWFVSARIDAEPGPAPRPVLAVEPLFDGWAGSDFEPSALGFTTPEGAGEVKVEYRATGHGGGAPRANVDDCIGPAEEFCRRAHSVFFDGRRQPTFTPWREDCDSLCTLTPFPANFGNGEYCAENPTGAVRSVQAPRANWCPGDLTEPFMFTHPGWAAAGDHDFAFDIPDVHPDGRWRISAVAYLYGE